MTTKIIQVKVDAGNSKKQIDTLDTSMKKLGKDTNLTVSEVAELDKVFAGVKKGLSQAAPEVVRTGKGFNALSKNAGQASIQLQQFIGQIQGGQSAMLALSQQGADLGIVLGAPLVGSIIGISSSIVGLLLPNLFKAKDEFKKLNEAAAKLDKTLTETNGITVFSDNLKKLAERSKALAKVQISQGFLDAEAQIKTAIDGITGKTREFIGRSGSELGAFRSRFSALAKSLGTDAQGLSENLKLLKLATLGRDSAFAATQIGNLTKRFKITEEQALSLSLALSDAFSDKDPASIKRLENELAALSNSFGGNNKKVTEFTASLIPLFNGVTTGVEKSNLLRVAFNDLSKAIVETDNKARSVGLEPDLSGYEDFLSLLDEFDKQELRDLKIAGRFKSQIESEKLRTEQLRAEIDVRDGLNKGELNQAQANEQLALNALYFSFETRRQAVLSETEKSGAQKAALIAQLDEQEILAEEVLQLRLTEAAQKGAQDRIAIEQFSAQQILGGISKFSSAYANIESKNQKKSNKLRKISVIADTAAGIQRSLSINPYDWANPAAIGLSGLAQLKAIGKSSSIESSPQGAATPVAAAQPVRQQQQNASFEILGVSELVSDLRELNGVLSTDAVANIFESFSRAGGNGLNPEFGG